MEQDCSGNYQNPLNTQVDHRLSECASSQPQNMATCYALHPGSDFSSDLHWPSGMASSRCYADIATRRVYPAAATAATVAPQTQDAFGEGRLTLASPTANPSRHLLEGNYLQSPTGVQHIRVNPHPQTLVQALPSTQVAQQWAFPQHMNSIPPTAAPITTSALHIQPNSTSSVFRNPVNNGSRVALKDDSFGDQEPVVLTAGSNMIQTMNSFPADKSGAQHIQQVTVHRNFPTPAHTEGGCSPIQPPGKKVIL